jgi:hypothetical protein
MTNAACVTCQHPGEIHAVDGSCRIGGCTCTGYDDGIAREHAPRSRRLCIDVPEGYAVGFSMWPHTESDAPPTFGEQAAAPGQQLPKGLEEALIG